MNIALTTDATSSVAGGALTVVGGAAIKGSVRVCSSWCRSSFLYYVSFFCRRFTAA